MLFVGSTKTLTVETDATATTTEPNYSVDYLSLTPNGLAESSGLITQKANPHDAVGPLTGATAVVVVPAIDSGSIAQQLVNLTVFNADTVSHVITVKKKDGSTGYTVKKATVGVGEALTYDGKDWAIVAATGEPRLSQLSSAMTAAGAKNGATVSVVETGAGPIHQTTFTFTATPITMRDTQQGGGVKIYDFPEGRISFLGATGSIAVTTTSIILNTLNGGVTCNWGVGTTTQASATLATTEQDILNVTAFTSSAVINVAGAASNGVGTATVLDGTATAKDAFLNLAVAGATDIDADATVTVTGSVTITWLALGDY